MDKIKLGDSLVGENYFATRTEGPFIRVTSSSENHIEDGLQFWWKNTDKETIESHTDKTADMGTILHGYFAGLMEGEEIDVKEDWAEKPIKLFKEKFIEVHKPRTEWTEKTMVSRILGLGGTCDWHGVATQYDKKMRRRKEWILDWKTGNFYESQFCQIATYMFMVWENFGVICRDIGIVQVHRDGKKFAFKPCPDPLSALRAGLMVYERWKWDNQRKLRWVMAPKKVLLARSKARGRNRAKFEEKHWLPHYQWPWLERDSLEALAEFEILFNQGD